VPTVDDSVTINAPAQKIFEFVSDGANLPVYDSSCLRATMDGPAALGVRTSGVTKLLGREIEWTTECTEFEPSTSVAGKSVEGKLTFEFRYLLAPEGDGTRVDYTIKAESGLGGIFGRLADPLVTKTEQRQVKANLGVLKDLMEDGAA
jgi:uncharacterized membrane protein